MPTRGERWLLLTPLALILLPFLIWPAVFGLLASFADYAPAQLQFHWVGLANYMSVVSDPQFLVAFRNIAIFSLVTVPTELVIGFALAYLLREPFRGQGLVRVQGFLVLASLPVMAYIIPLSDTLGHLHLQDTFVGVALADAAVSAPLAVYVLWGYLKQVSSELQDAARLDGATLWRILWRVMLPVAMPGVAATTIIVFVLNWNLFLIPLVLTANHVHTVPVAMSDFFTFERELQWPTAAAALVVSLLPLVALVTVAHRALEQFSLHLEETA